MNMNEELYVTSEAGEAGLLARLLGEAGIDCRVMESAMWRGTPFYIVYVACADLPKARRIQDGINWEGIGCHAKN